MRSRRRGTRRRSIRLRGAGVRRAGRAIAPRGRSRRCGRAGRGQLPRGRCRRCSTSPAGSRSRATARSSCSLGGGRARPPLELRLRLVQGGPRRVRPGARRLAGRRRCPGRRRAARLRPSSMTEGRDAGPAGHHAGGGRRGVAAPWRRARRPSGCPARFAMSWRRCGTCPAPCGAECRPTCDVAKPMTTASPSSTGVASPRARRRAGGRAAPAPGALAARGTGAPGPAAAVDEEPAGLRRTRCSRGAGQHRAGDRCVDRLRRPSAWRPPAPTTSTTPATPRPTGFIRQAQPARWPPASCRWRWPTSAERCCWWPRWRWRSRRRPSWPPPLRLRRADHRLFDGAQERGGGRPGGGGRRFVLRAVAGAAATDVPISDWFFIVTSFGAAPHGVGQAARKPARWRRRPPPTPVGSGPCWAPTRESYMAYLRSVTSGAVLVAYCLWAFEKADAPEHVADPLVPVVDPAVRDGDPALRAGARQGRPGIGPRGHHPGRPDAAMHRRGLGHRLRHRRVHGMSGPAADTVPRTTLEIVERLGPQSRVGRHVVRPTDADELAMAAKAAGPRGAIARGLGRAYGDSAMNAGGLVVELDRRVGLLDLDHRRHRRVLAGTSLDGLLRAIVPQGWFLPVTPGTRSSPSAGPSPPTSTARTTTPPAASAPTCSRWCWACPTAPAARSPPTTAPTSSGPPAGAWA